MILSPIPFRRSIFLLALLSFGFVVNVGANPSAEDVDVPPLTGENARECLPYGSTLAGSSSMGSFTLAMNNPGLVPVDRAVHLEDTRLERNRSVFGIAANVTGDKASAFPVEFMETKEEELNCEFDGSHYLIRKIEEFGVPAFRLEEGQADHTCPVKTKTPFRLEDDRGGSWDEFGNALTDGTSDLAIADGDLTEWYVWVSS